MSTLEVHELDEHLKELVYWERVALHLPDFNQTDIDLIKRNCRDDVKDQKLDLYKTWLEKCPHASWSDVIGALEKAEQRSLASKLRNKFPEDQAAQQPGEKMEVKVSKDIVESLNELNKSFVKLAFNVKSEVTKAVENGRLSVRHLISLTEEERAFEIPKLKSVRSAEDYLDAIRNHYTFLNCYLLISVALMLTASKSIVNAAKKYSRRIETFKTKTEIKQLQTTLHPHFPNFPSKTSTRVIIMLQDTWGQQNMWCVEELVKMLFDLRHQDQCHWFRVIPGSLILIFSVPKHIMMTLIISIASKVIHMAFLGVIEIQVGDICFQATNTGEIFRFDDALLLATEESNTEVVRFFLHHALVNINKLYNIPPPGLISEVSSKIAPYETSNAFIHVVKELENLHQWFKSLSTETELRKEVKFGSLSLERLVRCAEEHITCTTECFNSITTIDDFLSEIRPRNTFLNCHLLLALSLLVSGTNASIAKYILESLEELKKFAMIKFLQHELQKYFVNAHPNINETVTIKLHNIWKKFRMVHLEMLIKFIFSLKHPDELQWFRVMSGSLIVVFTVPKEMMMYLIVNGVKKIPEMKLTGVLSLKVGNIYIFKNDKQAVYSIEEAMIQAKKQGFSELLQILSEQMRFDKKDHLKDWNNNMIFINHYTFTPLILASRNGDTQLVKLFLDHKADPNAPNGMEWTPLMYASILGSIKIMNSLLHHGANINTQIHDGQTALMSACSMGNLRVVNFLLSKQADVNVKRNDGSTALHLASALGHPNVVSALLKAQVDPNSTTDNGSTALHFACIEGHLDVVEVLLEKGANLNAQNINGRTPLIRASQENHLKILDLLLKFQADPTIQAVDGSTALNDASFNGHLEIVKRLLQEKLDINIRTDLEETPLYSACCKGHFEVAVVLIEAGANVNIGKYNGEAPLHTASEYGYLPIVSTLLSARADPNAKTNKRLAPIHLASYGGHYEVVSELLDGGADPDPKSNDGLTPLFLASREGHLGVVTMLLKAQVDPNILVGEMAPLHIASYKRRSKIVSRLIEAKADVNLQLNDGTTPLLIASQNGHLKVVRILLEAGANANIKANDEATPIYIASFEGHLKVVKELLKGKANPNAQGVGGSIPLYAATCKGHSKIVKILLGAGVDPNIPMSNSSLPIIKACSEGHMEVLQALLEAKANPNVQFDGQTPLNIACENNNLHMLESLLRAGADPNFPSTVQMSKSDFEKIISSLSLDSGHSSQLHQKLWGRETNSIDVKQTPLQVAANKGHLEAVNLLLRAKANPNIQNIFEETLLYQASSDGNLKLASLLLEAQADPNMANSDGNTPLHIAISNHHFQIIDLLLAAKADLTRRSAVGCGETPLITASVSGYSEAVERLLQEKADPNVQATTGETPLLFASKYSHLGIVRMLLKAGANPNLQNINGITALHLASENGTENVHVQVIKTLLEAGADPTIQNRHKTTPIHIASQCGHLEVLEMLVETKGNPTPEELDAIEKLKLIHMFPCISQ